MNNYELIEAKQKLSGDMQNAKEQRRLHTLQIEKNKAKIKELNEEIENLKVTCQMYENTLTRKRAKKRAQEAAKKHNDKIVLNELNKNAANAQLTIDKNIMIGEDYRS